MSMTRFVFVVAILVAVSACNDGNSPTAPTPTTTTPPVTTPPVTTPPTQPTITNYAGRWTGSYIVEQCAGASGSMDDVLCSAPRGSIPGGIFQRGVTLPMTLELGQGGSAVNGTLSLGQIRGPVSGSVVNGALILSGAPIYSDAAGGLVVTNTVTQWDTVMTDGGFLVGTFTFNVKVNVFPGDGTVRVRLSNVRR